jgi:hypothetical protein
MALPPPPPPASIAKGPKSLSADALYEAVRDCFAEIPDRRGPEVTISLPDALMSAFSMFTMKDPSLLAFDQHRHDHNLKALFHIGSVPCDTQMREILDPVAPERLREPFNEVFRRVQRGKALERFRFLGGYLLGLDGTGYFSSQHIHCNSCLVKEHRDGTVTYEHQMLGAVILHPDLKEVIPLAPEPIQKQDGHTKNDCERNAARRLLAKTRREHPHLKLTVVEDGLASNAPHIRDLKEYGMHFILGVKPGDHAFLFAAFEAARRQGRVTTISRRQDKFRCEVSWKWNLPLNESNQDLRVDFLEYKEYDLEGKCLKHFTWITDLPLTLRTVWDLVRAGRARWHIENETFNTLKNQGYEFEHNYGHGKQNLSVVFAMLMMLAFLVDQVQQLTSPLFRATWKRMGTKRLLWERLRSHFANFRFCSMEQLYRAMLFDWCKDVPVPEPVLDSS